MAYRFIDDDKDFLASAGCCTDWISIQMHIITIESIARRPAGKKSNALRSRLKRSIISTMALMVTV